MNLFGNMLRLETLQSVVSSALLGLGGFLSSASGQEQSSQHKSIIDPQSQSSSFHKSLDGLRAPRTSPSKKTPIVPYSDVQQRVILIAADSLLEEMRYRLAIIPEKIARGVTPMERAAIDQEYSELLKDIMPLRTLMLNSAIYPNGSSQKSRQLKEIGEITNKLLPKYLPQSEKK